MSLSKGVRILPFSRWTLVTAGLGAVNHAEAATRVKAQAELAGFENILVATNENIIDLCPLINSYFPNLLSANNSGYGFWSYKPELLLHAFSRNQTLKSGVLWVDAGCEINLNFFSSLRLRLYMLIARVQGAAIFELKTPEKFFTKKVVGDLFPMAAQIRPYSQVQATWFLLHGETGRRIAKRWLEVILQGEIFVNSSFNSEEEIVGFVAPRNDQSIFSLICKEEGIRPLISTPPTGRGDSRIARLRAHSYPIWVSRNRSGSSIKNLRNG